jgi:phosphoglycolate phosphatase
MSSDTVVLWDIDGTLMRTPGVGVRAFAQAIESVTGLPMAKQRYDFGGKTDPLIALELLAALDLTDPGLVDAVLAEVERNYSTLADELRATLVMLPGVPTLLAACESRDVGQTVVTGNIEVAARHKLAAGGIEGHLALDCGGYGSDHHDRSELVRLALERLGRTRSFDPGRVWVVGDTPRDAACAAANGVHCLLVATGTYSYEQLSGLGADVVLHDLADVDAVLSILGV